MTRPGEHCRRTGTRGTTSRMVQPVWDLRHSTGVWWPWFYREGRGWCSGRRELKSGKSTVLLRPAEVPRKGLEDPHHGLSQGIPSHRGSSPAGTFYAKKPFPGYHVQTVLRQGGTEKCPAALPARLGSCLPRSPWSSFSCITDRSHVHLGENDKTLS